MSTIEQALQQAEQMAVATAAEEQEYQYSTQYLRRTQYVSDNAPIDVVNKEIQSMNDEISVKGEAISQYIEFRLDRHQDGIDLLGMLFNIHYEKSFYGGEDRPINVRYNDTKIILGWAIPNAAVKEAGVLNMCIWATGRLYDDTYVWKTKPKSYTVNDGLTIAENIIEPDENWYVQFVNELEAKIQEFSGRVDDIVQVEESLSTDVQVINEKYDSIMASAETAGQSAASAQTSEQNAQLYKEQTQQIAEQVKEEVAKVYKYQGSVPTYNDLPTENVSNGDVYNVESDGMNYAWDGANQKWDSLGIIIDLSKYSTTEQIELMLNQYVQKESGKGLFSGSYDDLSNKPKIEGTELSGNKTLDELNIASKTAIVDLNNNLSQLEIDLKMLGYTVPKEMPVQNYVDSDGVFHQRVGRVDLKDALFEYNNIYSLWSSNYIKNIAKYSTTNQSINTNFYSNMYSVYTGSLSNIPTNSLIFGTSGTLWINNSSSTEKPSGYLYFELAEEVLIKVDGNEAVTKVNESLSVIGKCKNLLNPTLQTTTVNGVTCTANGDGTYTLNGTATENTNFQIVQRGTAISVGTYKLVDIDGTDTTFFTYLDDIGVGTRSTDNQVFTVSSNATYGASIVVRKGIVLNNLVFKPMLTTNLNATYDDFVPYTGDGETLTHDVAVIKSDLSGINHNTPRLVPKDITSYYTDGTLWDRLEGTNGFSLFEDIFAGDYFKMSRAISAYNQDQNYQLTGSQYVTIAGIDTLCGNGDNISMAYHHLVMVPGQGFGGTQHFGRSRMNKLNTTEGGYVGSEMHTTTIGVIATEGSTETTATINQQLYAEFGSHLKTTRELLSNAINSTGYNRFCSNNGCSNNWIWTNCQAVLMSEIELYGSIVWSSSGYDTGNANKQLPLFVNGKQAINNRSAWYWLKDVASASYFCYCDGTGVASYSDAGYASRYVRPRFVIAA